ncbi:hypothetical protein BDW22DRAFT_966196 [Trametopsis cervina]|nr:hypothetical protein BDW22DRAFT_966196 [Trametopsis cervina]
MLSSLFLLAAASVAVAVPAPQFLNIPGLPTGILSCPTPATLPKYNNTRLPNPFAFNDGTAVRSIEDWVCRRAQISALVQGYEAGYLPPRPSIVHANFTQNGTTATLGVTAGFANKTISFTSNIIYPAGKPPLGGWPLLLAYGGPSIPVPAGVAVLDYNNDALGVQNSLSSRGQGLFFDLYGSSASASAMTAWVWGLSRVIDAIELTPKANINLFKLAVTGCSRNGKGALMAGAFETRIALTIPQESGSGGDTCWRLSKFEQDSGDVVQQATEIVQENVWFSPTFDQYVNSISTLPYDHHMLAAMVAPRALISFENTDFEWLSPLSGFGCMTAAHTVYTALGIPQNHGFVQGGNHSHCAFPANQNDQLNAFFDKFLLNKNANTNIFTTNGLFNGTVWDPSVWINWKTPRLSLI